MAGNPGCGKTYTCAAILAWMHGKVGDIYATKESTFLAKIRSSFDMKGDYSNEVKYQCEHDFFIFDDLGSTGQNANSNWRVEVLFEMINLRYESKNPTIITTNYGRSEIREKLGERTHSRLYAQENCIIEMFDYPDFRYPSSFDVPMT